MNKLLVPFLLLCCLLLTACGKGPPDDPFSYVNTPMTLTVRGEITMTPSSDKAQQGTGAFTGVTRPGEPLSFSATIRVNPLPQGQVADDTSAAEDRWRIRITYTAPDALAGMTVTCVVGQDGTATDATLSYPAPDGAVSLSLPFASVQGLLRPALCFWPQGDITAVSPVKDGEKSITVTDTDGESIYYFGQASLYPEKIEVTEAWGKMHLYLAPAK